jgi:hypothetical protein
MIVELAIATRTHPDQWWDTDDAVIVTALDVLDDHARAADTARR